MEVGVDEDTPEIGAEPLLAEEAEAEVAPPGAGEEPVIAGEELETAGD